jgi:hypothetical protein
MQKILESLLGGLQQDAQEDDQTQPSGILESLTTSAESKRESEEAAERIWKKAILDQPSKNLSTSG